MVAASNEEPRQASQVSHVSTRNRNYSWVLNTHSVPRALLLVMHILNQILWKVA